MHRDLHSFPTRRSSDLNLRTPSGVSYVLENRRTMARVQPDLFGGERVRRVSGYPGRLLAMVRSEEHTSELQSRVDLVCRLLLEKKNGHSPSERCIRGSL